MSFLSESQNARGKNTVYAVCLYERGLKRRKPELKLVQGLSMIQAQAREGVRIGESARYE